MKHARKSLLIGLAAMVVHGAYGQPSLPVRPHLIMWPLSDNVSDPVSGVTPNPSSAIPIVRDDRNTGENRGTVYSPEVAALFAYNALAADYAGGWIDGTHLALFPRYVGADVFVQDAASYPPPQDPDFDPRTRRDSTEAGYAPWPSAWTFFYPNDRLVGLYDFGDVNTPNGAPVFPGVSEQPSSTSPSGQVQFSPGAGNRSYRHPFLSNATRNDQDPAQASPLRAYMLSYASELRSQLDASTSPLQGAQPTFIFDAEQAHIVQRPDKHSCIYMLWFLTQATVPGNPNQFIWDTFKVPGSVGWVAPTMSEIYENRVIPNGSDPSGTTGFATTTGKTLAELYAIERGRQNPSAELDHWTTADTEDYRQHWPSSFTQLQALLGAYANSASILPDDSRVRGIMLWWMEVCAKAEGAIWENAVFGPLHAQFPDSKFINYTQMTVDGRVDASSTVHDLSQLPTPGWPESDERHSPASGAPLIPTWRWADSNRDGNEDQDDLLALVHTIAGGGCPG